MSSKPESVGSKRVIYPDRHQMHWDAMVLEERLAADHPARLLWQATGALNLDAFYSWIKSVDGSAGRPAIDPRVLLCLWLLATSEDVGSARELDRLCHVHDAYRWVAGGIDISYHTLSDFRVQFKNELDDLFTQILGKLAHAGVITVTRVSQDGTRVPAWAGKSSFHRESTLKKHLEEAKAHVERLSSEADDPTVSDKKKAAMKRAADEKLARVTRALEVELPKVRESREGRGWRLDDPARKQPPRASTTDPDCRRMKMPNGGFQPAYNVQLGVDTASRAIVGVDATNQGKDSGLCSSMREQVERRTGLKVKEHLTDEGYRRNADIVEAAAQGVAIYRPPPPLPKGSKRASVYEAGPDDDPAVVEWKKRMESEAGQTIYKERCSTVETVNADLKTNRALGRIRVRGSDKAMSCVLLSTITYNLLMFMEVLVNN